MSNTAVSCFACRKSVVLLGFQVSRRKKTNLVFSQSAKVMCSILRTYTHTQWITVVNWLANSGFVFELLWYKTLSRVLNQIASLKGTICCVCAQRLLQVTGSFMFYLWTCEPWWVTSPPVLPHVWAHVTIYSSWDAWAQQLSVLVDWRWLPEQGGGRGGPIHHLD